MARLASTAHAGFYPTPPAVVDLISTMLGPAGNGPAGQGNTSTICLLDPCCGEGRALAQLARRVRSHNGAAWQTYGNELHQGRAQVAQEALDYVLCGPMEFLLVEGGFGAQLFNPPYDRSEDLSGRRELDLLKQAIPWLAPGGLMVAIVSEKVMARHDFLEIFVAWHEDVVIRRFPPEHRQFEQVVAFGTRREKKAKLAYWEKKRLDALLRGEHIPDVFKEEMKQKWKAFAQEQGWAERVPIQRGQALRAIRDAAYTRRLSVDDLIRTLQRRGIEYEKLFTVVELGVIQAFANALLKVQPEDVPDLQAGEFQFEVPRTHVSKFQLSLPCAAQALQEVEAHGVTTTDAWAVLTASREELLDFQPLMALGAGHVGMLIGAGMLDGVRLGELLIKGQTVKYKLTETTRSHREEVTVISERLAAVISVLNLTTGELLTFDSRDPGPYEEFLAEHAEALAEAVTLRHRPLYVGDNSRYDPYLDRVRSPSVLPGYGAKGLLPAQRDRAAALAACLEHHKAGILVGENGVGKTITSLAALVAYKGQALEANPSRPIKVVVMCPSHLVRKWKREVEKALADFGARAHICRKPSDVRRAMAEPGLSILVLSKEAAKQGPRWEHAYQTAHRRVTYTVEREEWVRTGYYRGHTRVVQEKVTKVMEVFLCPDCGEVLREDGELWGGEKWKSKGKGKKRKCPFCGSPLWQKVPYKTVQKEALAHFINRHFPGRYFLILDEAHEYKGPDTDQAYAATDLISGARKVIAMTGTIYGGRASTLFHLLYRLVPDFRLVYGYDDVEKFVEHYGLREETIRQYRAERYSSAHGYWRKSRSVREKPGASPGMVSLLLPRTVFLRLKDLGIALPPYQEYELAVSMGRDDDPHQKLRGNYNILDVELRDKAIAAWRSEGDRSLLSAWLWACLGYPDCPEQDEEFEQANLSVTGLPMPEYGWAKDRALLELVLSEQSEGRGILIYFGQVNRRDGQPRIQEVLSSHGVDTRILRGGEVPAEDREKWIEDAVGDGCQVLITNPQLVATGLDLLDFPTIVFYGICGYSIYSLIQAARRSWRLGQDKPVKVVFMYWKDTLQEKALGLIADKLRAAKLIDGEVAEGLAAMNSPEGNFIQTLMRRIGRGTEVDTGSPLLPAYLPTVCREAGPLPPSKK